MKKIILITFLLANLSFAFGQNLSVETTPQGNGFILDGVSIDFRKAALDATGREVQFRNDGIYTNYAFVNYNFKGGRNVTKYRYNGKTYTAGYDPNKECNFLPISPIVPVEVTISIRVNGKTYSKTVENSTGGGIVKPWESFKLDDFVKVDNKSNAVSLVSITVRPLPHIDFEKGIERGEECKKRKENEKKAKEIADREAEKEAKGQKTNKKDDDFWSGGEETKLKIVMPDAQKTANTASKQPETKKQETAPITARNNKAYNGKADIELVAVEGGTYRMGEGNKSKSVTVGSFSIGKYEVTVAQYRNFCNATGTSMPDLPEWGWIDDHPIANVSWNDAVAYTEWLSREYGGNWRLPTEAEWEYAARGGNKSNGYEYSGSNNIGEVAWYTNNSGRKTHPTGAKRPNELGIYDMTGNVWEWCNDLWFREEESSSRRRIRGGSWDNTWPGCRVAFGNYYNPDYRSFSIGFRVVLSE